MLTFLLTNIDSHLPDNKYNQACCHFSWTNSIKFYSQFVSHTFRLLLNCKAECLKMMYTTLLSSIWRLLHQYVHPERGSTTNGWIVQFVCLNNSLIPQLKTLIVSFLSSSLNSFLIHLHSSVQSGLHGVTAACRMYIRELGVAFLRLLFSVQSRRLIQYKTNDATGNQR